MSQLPSRPAPHPPGRAPVAPDDGWCLWIAENRLRDCTPASMLQVMVAAGLDPALSRDAIDATEASPAFRAARRHQQLLRKLESVLANQQRLWEAAPGYGVVERRHSVSDDEFMARFVHGSRPLVLTGVADDWPALRRWSPQDLKARFGHLEVEVQHGRADDPLFEQNKLRLRRQVMLADYVDQVLRDGVTNDHYMTANNETLRRPGFAPLLDDIGTLPTFCRRDGLAASAWLWFGPAGTRTPLHHDTVMLLHTQVVGRKRWRFVSPLNTPQLYNHVGVFSPIDLDQPDLARYPRFAQVQVLDTVVGPGETVFLPLGWWHQVSALDVSLSLSYSNLAVPGDFRYDNPDLPHW